MDPIAARDLFPLTAHHIFLNHAGVAPISDRARAAVGGVLESLSGRPYPDGFAQAEADRVRAALARLVGASPELIGLTRSTAHGISLLAQGLDWRAGDNVVGVEAEYPANVYAWQALRDRGVEYRVARPEGGRVTAAAILEHVDERTRVVALSHVQFWTGFRSDLAAIGAELDRRGVLFAVDAAQSAGALRLNLESLPVDFLSTTASKWMLGPQGIGFCYVRPELLGRLRPVLVGTGTVTGDREHFEPRFELCPTARRFEESAVSVLDLAALGAAVELLLEVGPETVERRVLALAQRLAAGLLERGYEIAGPWPRTPAESSGIVTFRDPGGAGQALIRDLSAARIVGRVHASWVRLSPHFYNTESEIDRVLDVLAPHGMTPA